MTLLGYHKNYIEIRQSNTPYTILARILGYTYRKTQLLGIINTFKQSQSGDMFILPWFQTFFPPK